MMADTGCHLQIMQRRFHVNVTGAMFDAVLKNEIDELDRRRLQLARVAVDCSGVSE